MKYDLSRLHSQAIQRQVASKDQEYQNMRSEKQHENVAFRQKQQILNDRNIVIKGIRAGEQANVADFLRKQKEIPSGLNDQITGVRIGNTSPYG